MPLGMRCWGAQGLLLLLGCLWLMAWHNDTVNLGLERGCRPFPALSCRLCQVIHLLIWHSSFLVQGSLDHRKEILCLAPHLTCTLLGEEWMSNRGKGHSRWKTGGNLQIKFCGIRKLEVTKQPNSQESLGMWQACLLDTGRAHALPLCVS